MPLITVSNSDLYYEDHGEGFPVVFLHGLGGDSGMFRPQVQVFSDSNRVITCDMRGHGKSNPIVPKRDHLSILAEDLNELFDHLNIEQAVVCGVSFGGIIAQRFALDFPDRCKALVLCDTLAALRYWRPLTDFLLWLVALSGIKGWMDRFYLSLPERWQIKVLRNQYGKWPLAYENLMAMTRRLSDKERLRYHRLAVKEYTRVMAKMDFRSELGRISCPTLCIAGSDFPFVVRYMKDVVSHIPKAELKVVENSCDPTNLCQPDVFNFLVKEFLERLNCRS